LLIFEGGWEREGGAVAQGHYEVGVDIPPALRVAAAFRARPGDLISTESIRTTPTTAGRNSVAAPI